MLPISEKYRIYPSVFPADKKVKIKILPASRAFLMFEDKEYTIKVIPMNADVASRDCDNHVTTLSSSAKNGYIEFEHIFSGEQEHTVLLYAEEKQLAAFSVYSLLDDLYCKIPLRGDLHSHSYRSDGQQDPADIFGHYREQGYDFLALTDHNRYYPGGEIDEVYADVHLGITHIQGEEIHVPGTPVHIVGVGEERSVAEIYIENSPEYQKELEQYKANVPDCVPPSYSERYAMAKWATDKIRSFGGVAIFPHPFWRPNDSKAFNVCDGLASLFLTDGLFDAYELIGGNDYYNNRSVAFWNELRSKGVSIPVVGSSDVHEITRSSEFPHRFTVCFASSAKEADILDAIREGMSLAVEAEGTEYERSYRSYGSLRLVAYGAFLFKHYFPALQRVCQGEGVAMRNYAMGRTSAENLEQQVRQTEEFKACFFGHSEPIPPSKEIIDFEDRWRKRHEKSPVTKGSKIYSDKILRQI